MVKIVPETSSLLVRQTLKMDLCDIDMYVLINSLL